MNSLAYIKLKLDSVKLKGKGTWNENIEDYIVEQKTLKQDNVSLWRGFIIHNMGIGLFSLICPSIQIL